MATSVPKVPGAFGARPAPKPSAMKCAGWARRNFASGPGEVVVSAAIDAHRLAVGSDQAHALAALHLADAREGHAEDVGELGDAVARGGRGGEAELVVVAAREDRGEARPGGDGLRADPRARGR